MLWYLQEIEPGTQGFSVHFALPTEAACCTDYIVCKHRNFFIPPKGFTLKSLFNFSFKYPFYDLYLIADIGNTLSKFFLFNKGHCVIKQSALLWNNLVIRFLSLISNYNYIKGLIYSDVSTN